MHFFIYVEEYKIFGGGQTYKTYGPFGWRGEGGGVEESRVV